MQNIIEAFPPEAISETIGVREMSIDFYSTVSYIRNLITVALGSIKELKGQAVEKYGAPGMRIILGEIIGCLGTAKAVIDRSPHIVNKL